MSCLPNNTWSEVVRRYTKKSNNYERAVVESVPNTPPKSVNYRSGDRNSLGNDNSSPKTAGKKFIEIISFLHVLRKNESYIN